MVQHLGHDLSRMTLQQLADYHAGHRADSSAGLAGAAEFQRRQTQALLDAANAAKETAEHTRRSATYIWLSVLAIAAASVIQAAATWFSGP